MGTVGMAMALALLGGGPPAAAIDGTIVAPPGVHDFDLLRGAWKVRHRYLRITGAGRTWVEVDGTCVNEPLMEGVANIEEHHVGGPAGGYRALGLRAFDPKARAWSIWWLNERYPAGPLGPPVRGRFEDGVGRFYSDYVQDGMSTQVRYMWSEITPVSARWEQATSTDGGRTWDANWIMTWRRRASALSRPPA